MFIRLIMVILLTFIYMFPSLADEILFKGRNLEIVLKKGNEYFNNSLKFYALKNGKRDKKIYDNEVVSANLEKSIDINRDGIVDVLWLTINYGGNGACHSDENLFIFINKKTPRFLSLHGWIGQSDVKNEYVNVRVPANCSDNRFCVDIRRNLITKKTGLACDCSKFAIYKIDMNKQAFVLDKEKMKEYINSELEKLKNHRFKYMIIFRAPKFLSSIPLFRHLKVDRETFFELNDFSKIKIVDLLCYQKDIDDLINLFSIANTVDEDLARYIIQYFMFEDSDVYKEFLKDTTKFPIEPIIYAK